MGCIGAVNVDLIWNLSGGVLFVVKAMCGEGLQVLGGYGNSRRMGQQRYGVFQYK